MTTLNKLDIHAVKEINHVINVKIELPRTKAAQKQSNY